MSMNVVAMPVTGVAGSPAFDGVDRVENLCRIPLLDAVDGFCRGERLRVAGERKQQKPREDEQRTHARMMQRRGVPRQIVHIPRRRGAHGSIARSGRRQIARAASAAGSSSIHS